jgi:hypothetical protein
LIDLDFASSFTAAFVTNFAGGVLANADDALIAGFESGRSYFNIHTDRFPGGEIRGFLQVSGGPGTFEPGLVGSAAAGARPGRTPAQTGLRPRHPKGPSSISRRLMR